MLVVLTVAYSNGFIDKKQLEELATALLKSGYGDYLMSLVKFLMLNRYKNIIDSELENTSMNYLNYLFMT